MISFTDMSKGEKTRIFQEHDYFFFDIDGVIYHSGSFIPEADEVLKKLHACGKIIKLCTNNCVVSRQEIHKTLSSAIPFLKKEDIISSSFLAAKYFEKRIKNKKIYALGEKALMQELADLKLDYINSKNEKITSLADLTRMKLNKDVGAVLLGSDLDFTYFKLVELVNYVRDPQVAYVQTHVDKFMKGLGDISLIPGAGAMAAAVEAVTGRRPINVGKPSDFAGSCLRSGITQGGKAVFVGDIYYVKTKPQQTVILAVLSFFGIFTNVLLYLYNFI